MVFRAGNLPARTVSRCPGATRTACPLHVAPCCSPHVALCCSARRALLQPVRRALLQPARRALLQPARRALLPRASRPAVASALRSAAPRVAPNCSPRVTLCCPARCALLPCCPAQRAPCCPVHRTPCPAARGAPCQTEPRCPAHAALPNPSRAALPRSPAPPSHPAATTAAAAARATAAAGGGAAGSVGSAAGAGGAGGATGSAGGAAGAGGAGPTTDRHYLSWPLSLQLRRLGVDSGGQFLSMTTPPLSSFASGFFNEPIQVVEALVFYVLHRGGSRAAAPGASESAAALGASESAAALGASESAAALGAHASPAIGPSSVEALHTFTLDSGAARCFFRDCTTLTPLAALVPVSLADPTGGPVVARASTVLPCPADPSGSLSGLHLPTFTTNMVSNAAIQYVWVDTFIPGGQRVAIYTSAQVAEAGQVAASSQVSASGQLAASFSCPEISHQTLLWHHRLSHPSLLRLRSMNSRLLVSGLPRSLPSLPSSPAPPCLPCVEGRQRAAPRSFEFPPTTTPLQTLHMDVWGPALVSGMDQERYFLLVVDDYIPYTTVFPLRRKADVSGVLIPWIRATRRQLCERFRRLLPIFCGRLRSDTQRISSTSGPVSLSQRDLAHTPVDGEGWRCDGVSGLGHALLCS
ncbi:unnamed protein product [Closterium sp. NIES-54]